MNPYKKALWLVSSILSIICVPLFAAYLKYDGHFPDGYFSYPATVAVDKPGFDLTFFLIILAMVLFTASLYLFPRLYGFKPEIDTHKSASTVKLPWWFWAGIPIALFFQILAWGKFAQPAILVRNSYIPIFWAYGMILDGVTYYRSGGKSFFADYGKIFMAVATCSGINWAFFGYLNFFLDANWYYPDGSAISTVYFVIYAFLGSMTLAPMVFVAYHLLMTIPLLRRTWANGPKMLFPKWAKLLVLAVMCAGMFAVPFHPYELYPFLWIGPTFIFLAVLSICKVWTPLTPIKDGNWTPLAVIALAGFVQGFLWEGMNYFSATHTPGEFATNVPGYWIYSIPYVEFGHIFEMPALGFFGYMPYGLFCWAFWILFAEMLNIPPAISHYEGNGLSEA